jgi:type I restriction enzyme M protein
MTVIRRLDALLEPTKDAVLRMKEHLDRAKVANQDAALCKEAKQAFYNASPFTLRRMLDNPKQLGANFEAYLSGFSANVQEILLKFKFNNQIPTLVDADALGHLIAKFISPDINLSPKPVLDGQGGVKLPGLDNHSMGTVFEELIRRFNEENNEEAGEHFTPREVIKLMVNLLLSPEKDLARSHVVKTIYDPACGTGGMLSVAEQYIRTLNTKASPMVYGQDWNDEAWAVCKSDMLIKGEDADNIAQGDTFTKDGFARDRDGKKWTFDYMLANPPFGVEWKQQQKYIEQERDTLGYEGRFGSGLPRINDGALLFL